VGEDDRQKSALQIYYAIRGKFNYGNRKPVKIENVLKSRKCIEWPGNFECIDRTDVKEDREQAV
jgi:hypothetical protein